MFGDFGMQMQNALAQMALGQQGNANRVSANRMAALPYRNELPLAMLQAQTQLGSDFLNQQGQNQRLGALAPLLAAIMGGSGGGGFSGGLTTNYGAGVTPGGMGAGGAAGGIGRAGSPETLANLPPGLFGSKGAYLAYLARGTTPGLERIKEQRAGKLGPNFRRPYLGGKPYGMSAGV